MQIHKIFITSVSLFVILGFSGCGGGSGGGFFGSTTGTLSLNLADAPLVDEENVTGVYITVSRIEYHASGDGWKTMEDFNTSVNPINLFQWQDGKSISLGDFQMPAGKYTQIRFMLDAVEENQKPQSNTGCFIEINDANHTLYVPSGSESGYKAIGNYDVPVNGKVTITADFDVRKSVVPSGNGSYYKLKPTIKLIVTSEAGTVQGSVSGLDADRTYVIYAYKYENGSSTWNSDETNDQDPSDSADIRFPNAVTSAVVKDRGAYTLSFLSAGTYDLIIARYDGNGEYETYYIETGAVVDSGETTIFNWIL